MAYLTLEFEGRNLQLKPEQLSVAVIAKAFRLIPDTILLVSERGRIAVPEDGIFVDVDYLDVWTVQGDKTTGPRIIGSGVGSSGGPAMKWKPQTLPQHVRLPGNSSRQVRSILCTENVVLKNTTMVYRTIMCVLNSSGWGPNTCFEHKNHKDYMFNAPLEKNGVLYLGS